MTNRNIIFQNFDAALDELKRKLYDGEYYNTPNSCVYVLYNIEIHGFQTFASSLCNSSSSGENGMSEYSPQLGCWKSTQIKRNLTDILTKKLIRTY